MANTYTLAGLQSALDAVQAAAAGEATRAALKTYATTYFGLPDKVTGGGGVSSQYPAPDKLIKALDDAGLLSGAALDAKRRGRFGVSHA